METLLYKIRSFEKSSTQKGFHCIFKEHCALTFINTEAPYWGEISIPHKLGFSEISPPQSLLPSNAQILNLMLVNLFIIVFILLVIHCVWQKNNKININPLSPNIHIQILQTGLHRFP